MLVVVQALKDCRHDVRVELQAPLSRGGAPSMPDAVFF
jgi:hypothetical protein